MNLNLYWIYLRSVRGMTLDESEQHSVLWEDLPERKLHAFFKTLQVPYQSYEAGSLAEYAAAIADIDQQQYQPLLVAERLPKQSRADIFLWLALIGLLLLAASFWLSYAGVRQAYRKTS